MARKRGYREMAERLRDLARTKSPGDRLPPEQAFADEFGTTRATISHAYDVLIAEGIVERKPGRKGYFVTSRSEISWQMTERSEPRRTAPGEEALSKVTNVRATRDVTMGTTHASATLHLDPEDQLLLVRESVWSADGVPVMMSRACLPYGLTAERAARGIPLLADDAELDIQKVLELIVGDSPKRVDHVRARPASETERTVLRMSPGYIFEAVRHHLFGARTVWRCYGIEQFIFPVTAEFVWTHPT